MCILSWKEEIFQRCLGHETGANGKEEEKAFPCSQCRPRIPRLTGCGSQQCCFRACASPACLPAIQTGRGSGLCIPLCTQHSFNTGLGWKVYGAVWTTRGTEILGTALRKAEVRCQLMYHRWGIPWCGVSPVEVNEGAAQANLIVPVTEHVEVVSRKRWGNLERWVHWDPVALCVRPPRLWNVLSMLTSLKVLGSCFLRPLGQHL